MSIRIPFLKQKVRKEYADGVHDHLGVKSVVVLQKI